MDGKAFQPDGEPAATLIPAAFGLAGVNLHTWTGWGSVTHWNAFVANLEMQGQGTFVDPRLNDPSQFPIAAAAGFADVRHDPDLVTPRLAALQFYQLSLRAPKPPRHTYDTQAAVRGEDLFNGKANCASCHVPPIFTEPGWNLHTAAEIGIAEFQAGRSPENAYRTAPLKGLWTRGDRGYYHDGRFPRIMDVIKHYNEHFMLGAQLQGTAGPGAVFAVALMRNRAGTQYNRLTATWKYHASMSPIFFRSQSEFRKWLKKSHLEANRYKTIFHPGDSFAFDIFSQAGQAIAHPAAGDPRPLGELTPRIKALLADGESQSANRLVTYYNSIHRLDRIYDGFLIHSTGYGGPLSYDVAAADIPPPPGVPATPFIFPPLPGEDPDFAIRTDLGTPLLFVNAEFDVLNLSWGGARSISSPTPARSDSGRSPAPRTSIAISSGCWRRISSNPTRWTCPLRASVRWTAAQYGTAKIRHAGGRACAGALGTDRQAAGARAAYQCVGTPGLGYRSHDQS